jgi:large repetitive protein
MARERAEKAERAAVRRLPGGHSRRFKLALAAVGAIAAIVVAAGSAADFDIDNGPCRETPGEELLLRCPTANVGVPYEVQIESEEGSGCTSPGNPYVWYEIVNSSLPAGLSMSRSGLISGTPTSAGFTRFWIWNHDLTASEGGPPWCKFEDRSEHEFSIFVDPGLAIVNQSVKPGSVGQPYSETLTAKRVDTVNPVTGVDVQASWSVQSGSLPPGITLSTAGALAGTPTSEGSYQFVVKAQNGGPFDTKTYTLAIRQPVTVRSPFASAQAPRAEVGIRFGATATATGGTSTYTWTLASGALPAGLALNAASGAVAGTPQSPGNFAFALTATDAEGRVATANGALIVAPRLAIRTTRLKTARLGHAYQAKLATGGGVRPVTWKVSGKLPPGVRFAKALGTLTGTPSRTGTFRLTVQAVDALGAKAQTKLVLDVRP